ncbi:MAG TPA: hypothetical protein VN844_12715 [Pyrinomonadaceae bacterium]|nr:hypothetical protein [Pyrinomonadaceae bacterium]
MAIDNRQWFHWLFDKVVTTGAAHFFNIARFDGKEATLVGAIFVNAAEGGSVDVLLQKRTFEDEFAARAAAVAFAATKREGRDGFFFAKVCDDEAAQFALGLARAKFCVGDLARANAPGGQTHFKRERFACRFH